MTITVTGITIIQQPNGPDLISCFTTLPLGQYPFNGFAEVDMRVAHGTGEEYVKKNFPGVTYEIVGSLTKKGIPYANS